MAVARSPMPLYHRIYAVLRERIVNNYYAVDAPLPGETELAELFSASRITIRRAMEMLTTEGLVTRSRGRGTFVSHSSKDNGLNRAVVSNINELLSYLNAVGESTRLKVISLETSEAPPRVSAAMGLPPAIPLVRAVRVRSLDRNPYSLSIAYILPEIGRTLTRQELATTNMIDLVQRTGGKAEQVEQTLKATLADEFAAKHLLVPTGAPLMLVSRVFFDRELRPMYLAEISYRADRYEYRISLKRDAENEFALADQLAR